MTEQEDKDAPDHNAILWAEEVNRRLDRITRRCGVPRHPRVQNAEWLLFGDIPPQTAAPLLLIVRQLNTLKARIENGMYRQ